MSTHTQHSEVAMGRGLAYRCVHLSSSAKGAAAYGRVPDAVQRQNPRFVNAIIS